MRDSIVRSLRAFEKALASLNSIDAESELFAEAQALVKKIEEVELDAAERWNSERKPNEPGIFRCVSAESPHAPNDGCELWFASAAAPADTLEQECAVCAARRARQQAALTG